jgi:hypothetical protein
LIALTNETAATAATNIAKFRLLPPQPSIAVESHGLFVTEEKISGRPQFSSAAADGSL